MIKKMFTSIGKRDSIKQLVANQIEDSILSKQYPPGSKLPSENELCLQFNVSRTSVREALQILAAHGLINIEKGKGIFVRKISSESVINPLEKYLKLKLDRNYVIDLVHIRQMIEPAVAREATLKHDIEDVEKMRKSIDDLKSCDSRPEIVMKFENEFHQLLAEATKNIVMPILIKPIHNMMPELKLKIFFNVEEAREQAIIWHTKILNAVSDGDQASAYDAMVEHLKIAEIHAKKLFELENNNSVK